MITKTDLKTYSFNSIEDYFQMIIESKVNGQISQMKAQIKELSKPQLKDFIAWCSYNVRYNAGEAMEYNYEYCKNIAIGSL